MAETFSKLAAQRAHAKKRFKERHGIDFNRNVRRFFISSIIDGKARFVQKQTNRVAVYDVDYNNKVYRVIYDRTRKNIITVMDNDENGNPVEVQKHAPTKAIDIIKEREFEQKFNQYKEMI